MSAVDPTHDLPIEGVTEMISERTRDFYLAYSGWFGKPVLLFVVRQCQVPIPCDIIAESAAAVRIRLQPGWYMDVPKDLILAVEEAAARDACMN
jgi:hypothetical protein